MDKALKSNPIPTTSFLRLCGLNLPVNAGALWWPGLHCTAFQRFWVEIRTYTGHLTPAYRVPYMQRAQVQ